MAYVSVDVDLGEIDTHDLVRELRSRGDYLLTDGDLKAITRYLHDSNCPDEIFKPLIRWLSEPVPTLSKLERWKELCTAGGRQC